MLRLHRRRITAMAAPSRKRQLEMDELEQDG